MDEEKNIKFLTKLRSALEDDAITRSEFVKAFEAVVKIVKDIKDTNSKEMTAIHQTITALSNKMQSDVSNEMSSAEKKSMDYCMKEMQKMYKEHEKKMSQMDEKMAMVQDGLDGKDADTAEIIKEVLSKVPPAPFLTSVEVRDRLEILQDGEKLSVQAIEGLSKLLEELNVKSSRVVSGGLISKRIRFVDDETPSGSGTAFTISRVPEAGSFKLYRGGARQRVTEDYTLSGKNLTLNIALAAGEILLCDFRY